MIEKTRDVSKAVEEGSTIPMLGFNNDKVDVEITDPDPIQTSVIINNSFFSFKLLYISFYNIHHQC